MPHTLVHTCTKAICKGMAAYFKNILSALQRREVLTNACCRIRVLEEVNSISLKWKHSVKGYLWTNQWLSQSHHCLDKQKMSFLWEELKNKCSVSDKDFHSCSSVCVIQYPHSQDCHSCKCWRNSTLFVLVKILEILQEEKSHIEQTFVLESFAQYFQNLHNWL